MGMPRTPRKTQEEEDDLADVEEAIEEWLGEHEAEANTEHCSRCGNVIHPELGYCWECWRK